MLSFVSLLFILLISLVVINICEHRRQECLTVSSRVVSFSGLHKLTFEQDSHNFILFVQAAKKFTAFLGCAA